MNLVNIIKESRWFIDSECSKYMTGDPLQFIKFKPKSSDTVTFENDIKDKAIGVGDVGKNAETFVHNILLVDNLSYNLLNVSQLCNRNLFFLFKKHECLIFDLKFNIIFKRKRFNDIYVMILENINFSNL